MGNKLLIRAYNVEVGDCIYVRIPDARPVNGGVEDFHMLIDCGSIGGIGNLERAMQDLEGELPNAPGGKKRLDLLIATHEHKDHILGFGLPVFKRLAIGQIWMNTAMDPSHPQASNTLRLRGLATMAMRRLANLNVELTPGLQELASLLDNDDAMRALRDELPKPDGSNRHYVSAGMTNTDTGLSLTGATIRVIGPEKDVDQFYLGQEADETLHGFAARGGDFNLAPAIEGGSLPSNISTADFRVLQSRMLSNALAFAELSSKVTNNTSVVLLIEWKGKRVLFVGDAEWNARFKEGKSNGAWNVMWHERKVLLDQPIHFLKIGHHGSENSTPWNDEGDDKVTEPETILDAILPLPAGSAKPKAQALVSTKRSPYKTIPKSAMLTLLGKRVSNTRNYLAAFNAQNVDETDLPNFTGFEKQLFGQLQPLRTDCEQILTGKNQVEVEIGA